MGTGTPGSSPMVLAISSAILGVTATMPDTAVSIKPPNNRSAPIIQVNTDSMAIPIGLVGIEPLTHYSSLIQITLFQNNVSDALAPAERGNGFKISH